jgi:Predicted flavoprotein
LPHPKPRILVFAGSIRSGSHNARLAALAAKTLALRDAEVTLISLADYPLPIYDGDLEAAEGVPENAKKLHRLFAAHQGIFIASPEYNGSYTPLLKNTIDWVSRVRNADWGLAFRGRVFAVGGASPGVYGAMRSLLHFRHVLEIGIGATVIPEQIAVGGAAEAFTDKGDFTAEANTRRLGAMLDRLVEEAARYASP